MNSELVGWAEPTGRANARPMINSAIPIKGGLQKGWVSRRALPILRSCRDGQVICPTGAPAEIPSIPSIKNISVFRKVESIVSFAPSRLKQEGRLANVRKRG